MQLVSHSNNVFIYFSLVKKIEFILVIKKDVFIISFVLNIRRIFPAKLVLRGVP
jgi:hypothetical protein